MRKVFREVYRLLDDGCGLHELEHQFSPTSSSARALLSALAHLHTSQHFDRTAFPGERILVGMDEVGRGPLAGPLVAVCIALPSPPSLPFLRDSKKLISAERQALVPRLKATASHVGYGVVQPDEFGGEINLHHLTFLAMSRAVKAAKLPLRKCSLLVDGKYPLPSWKGPQRAVIKGDDTSFHIAAASVLAKVYRDAVMTKAAKNHPHYGFESNSGYGTSDHCQALRLHGLCALHRPNFVRRILEEPQLAFDFENEDAQAELIEI